MPPTKISLRFSETVSLSYLREQIADAINPKKSQIDLMFRGSFLKGEKLTLKDLKFEKGKINHVIVVDKPDEDNEEKKKLLKDIEKNLIEVLGMEYEHDFLRYVAEKM